MRMKLFHLLLLICGLMMTPDASAQNMLDRNGSNIGSIDSNGTIRNRGGSSVGKIDSDGTVRDRGGSSIGKIDSDGTIRNRGGSSMGQARGVPKEWAAAWFFFYFN